MSVAALLSGRVRVDRDRRSDAGLDGFGMVSIVWQDGTQSQARSRATDRHYCQMSD